MTLLLQALPRDTEFKMRPVRGSNVLRPAFGGPRQPFNRMGDHWALDVTAPGLCPEAAFELLVDLAQGGATPVALPVPEPEINAGAPGSPRVNGVGQAGMLLVVDGFNRQYPARKGKFFNIITGGRRYLYWMRNEISADETGAATLAIWPMLRVPPADNDVIDFATPMIEGLIDLPVGWGSGLLPIVTPETFTVEEVE